MLYKCLFLSPGVLTVTEWCDVMSTTLNMDLPWRNVCQRLAESDSNDLVRYESTFDDYIVRSKYDGVSIQLFLESMR